MTLFDLLFLGLALAAIVSLVVAAAAAVRGRGSRALAILRRVGLVAAVYFGVLIVVSALAPRRVLRAGQDQCADDWCMAVAGVRRDRTAAGNDYEVSLRLSSRARRVDQRERFVAVYLRDRSGRRYDPLPDAHAVPFDTLLHPGEAVLARRHFQLPAEAAVEGLVLTRTAGAWFPGCCIIGDQGSLLHRPTIVRLE